MSTRSERTAALWIAFVIYPVIVGAAFFFPRPEIGRDFLFWFAFICGAAWGQSIADLHAVVKARRRELEAE